MTKQWSPTWKQPTPEGVTATCSAGHTITTTGLEGEVMMARQGNTCVFFLYCPKTGCGAWTKFVIVGT